MRRLLRLSAGLALFAGAVALAQPPAGGASTDLFPVKAGSKWTYKVAENKVEVRVDSRNEKKDDKGVSYVEATLSTIVNNKPVATETLEIRADGVYRTKINSKAVTPPVKFLPLPPTKDAKATVDSKVEEQPIKGTFTVKDTKEKVKVPAGEMEAVVVDGPEFEIAGTKTGVKVWFVPGKGPVKTQYNIGGNEAVLELEKYEEGK